MLVFKDLIIVTVVCISFFFDRVCGVAFQGRNLFGACRSLTELQVNATELHVVCVFAKVTMSMIHEDTIYFMSGLFDMCLKYASFEHILFVICF